MSIPKNLAVLSLGLLLCQCSAPGTGGIAADRYAELSGRTPMPAASYRLEVTFKGDGESRSVALQARPGKKVPLAMTREFVYPDGYRLAQTAPVRRVPASSNGIAPVTPVTPISFTKKDLGLTGSLSVRQEGAFVIVTGTVVHERFAGFSRAPGEAIAPIHHAGGGGPVTDNRVDLPNFVRCETPVYIAGLPGVPHTVELPAVPGRITIVCAPAE